jgi:FdhD protein
VDKIAGALLQDTLLIAAESLLLVSGRTSFEIVQKAIRAGIPFVAAVGAPSSLAVELANTFNLTLLGFTNVERFNIYSSPERVLTA